MTLEITGEASKGFSYLQENFDLDDKLTQPRDNGYRFLVFPIRGKFGPEEYQEWCDADPSGERTEKTRYIDLIPKPDSQANSQDGAAIIAGSDQEMAWGLMASHHGLFNIHGYGLLELAGAEGEAPAAQPHPNLDKTPESP